MRFFIGVIVGIVIGEIGMYRIAESLQKFVDTVKSFV
jgi:hypothetical protein